MKVLLFVQTGDARPKVCHTKGWLGADDAQHVREMYESNPTHTAPLWMHELRRADRWWLVECENAEAGRLAIKGFDSYVPSGGDVMRPLPCGRILASGGRR